MKLLSSRWIVALLLLSPMFSFGILGDEEDFGIFYGTRGGGSPLYPPQGDLVQFLVGGSSASFPSLDRVGVLSLPSVDGTNTIVQTDLGIVRPFWLSGSEFATNTYSDLIGHTNGVDGVLVKLGADSLVTDILTYENGWTLGEWTILSLWINIPVDSSPIAFVEYNADGTPHINADGTVELVQPE